MTDRLTEIMKVLERQQTEIAGACASTCVANACEARILGIDTTARAIMALDGWRPIKTAPKTGQTVILLWGGHVMEGYWLDNSKTSQPWAGWKYNDQRTAWPKGHPTHWQPLPALPATEG